MATTHLHDSRSDDFTTREWFAVQVRASRERLSADHLTHRGYEVFLPCVRHTRRWADRVKQKSRPMFPGYLFSRFAPQVFAKLVTSPGVIRVVGNSHGPLPIPKSEIESIQRIVDAQLTSEPSDVPRAGERVRIEVGPLSGAEGIVLQSRNGRRLVVSVPLLQRAVAVELDPGWVTVPARAAWRD